MGAGEGEPSSPWARPPDGAPGAPSPWAPSGPSGPSASPPTGPPPDMPSFESPVGLPSTPVGTGPMGWDQPVLPPPPASGDWPSPELPHPPGWAPPPGVGQAGPGVGRPGYAPLSAWTVASLVLVILCGLGLLVGGFGTVSAFRRQTPEGEFEEAYLEFFLLFVTVAWVLGTGIIGFVCSAIGFAISLSKGRVRPMAIVTLVITSIPVVLAVMLWLFQASIARG